MPAPRGDEQPSASAADQPTVDVSRSASPAPGDTDGEPTVSLTAWSNGPDERTSAEDSSEPTALIAQSTSPDERAGNDASPAASADPDRTTALPAADPDRTTALPAASADPDRTTALPAADPDRTTASPAASADPAGTGGLGVGAADPDRTTALAVGDADPDRTTAFPSGAAGADRTTALPAGDADPDRTTALPTGEADPDRTTAFPAGVADPDRTTAFPATGAGADRTTAVGDAARAAAAAEAGRRVAWTAAGDERTVAMSPGAGPAGRPPGSDGRQPSGAAPAASDAFERLKGARATQAAGEAVGRLKDGKAGQMAGDGLAKLKELGDEHPVARRRLLIGIPVVAGLAVIGGVTEAALDKSDDHAVSKPTTGAVVKPRPGHPVEKTTVKKQLPVQKKPIFTLKDYRRMTGGPAFPSDAVALTIDDGPHPVWTPKILRLLDKYHVPAMFCMIGNQVLGHEGIAQMVTKAGHQLANHTWSHPSALAGRTAEQVRKEIAQAQEKIEHTTGYAPKLFRSPGGDWSPTVLKETAAAGLIPLDWSVDPRDWSRPGVPSIESHLLAAHPGQILLCHDGGGDRSQTYASLNVVIPALKARGLRFVAL